MKETEEKLRREIEGFFEGFDEDADNLYQEEYQLLTKGKYKLKLKYPESFYEHWEKKFSDFVIKIKQQATTQTLTQVQEIIDKMIIEEPHIYSSHKGKKGKGFGSCSVCSSLELLKTQILKLNKEKENVN